MLYRATLADCDLMAAIHGSAFTGPDAWSANVFYLQLSLPNVFALICPSGGMILVRVAADEAEILTLAVTPSARLSGIGRTLLRAASIRAAAMGAHEIFLEVSVTNIAARHLYKQAGYVEAGRRPHYYLDKSDALVLRLTLNLPD